MREELLGAIRVLSEEERVQLVALAWLGRGTYDLTEWRMRRWRPPEANIGSARRSIFSALPLLGDYPEDGLATFGEGIVDEDDTREGLDGEDEPLGGDAPRHYLIPLRPFLLTSSAFARSRACYGVRTLSLLTPPGAARRGKPASAWLRDMLRPLSPRPSDRARKVLAGSRARRSTA